MPQIILNHTYVAAADLCTVAICVFNAIFVQSTYVQKNANLRLLKLGNALLVVAACISILTNGMINNSFGSPAAIYILHYILNSTLVLLFGVYAIYIILILKLPKKSTMYYITVSLILIIAHFIVDLLFILSKHDFWIEQANGKIIVHNNYYNEPYLIFYVILAGLCSYLLIKYRHKFVTKVFQTIVVVMITSFSLVLLQSLAQTPSFIVFSFAVPISAGLFLFHYNPFDTETGTLDARAFAAYVQEFQKEGFGIICLYLDIKNHTDIEKLSNVFIHFNEHYFTNPCTFRIGEDQFLMTYKNKENPNSLEKIETLTKDFFDTYNQYKISFKVFYFNSNETISTPRQYFDLCDYLKNRSHVNTFKQITNSDFEKFIRYTTIRNELKDITERNNLDDERINLYCQPVFNTETKQFNTAEALLRANFPTLGFVSPIELIPIAERSGYIHTLTLIMLNKACIALKDLANNGQSLDRISVNVSMTELQDKNFCDDILRVINSNGINPSKIAIELTESSNEEDFSMVKKIMHTLHAQGIKFYLDDFGTGYSNFSKIIGLPIDIVKFDRSLTIMSGKNYENFTLVNSFTQIFIKANYQVLFEGVEDEIDETRCIEMNASYLQGFKYSRPIPASNLLSFLENENTF